jgi:hypothetical protein
MAALPQKRFRVNPVELAIFSMVSLIFMNSVYNLFYDRQGFHPTTLAPMAANPITEGRSPASVGQAASSSFVELKCEPAVEQQVQGAKIRLTGKLCAPEKDAKAKLSQVQITNSTNQYNATVFTDTAAGKFSTDFIPLVAGKNAIAIEFKYGAGAKVEQKVTVSSVAASK